jgi:DNA-binding FadR family transcriptional regulator
MTQAALAEELGTVREVAVRALRALRRAGLVEAAGRGRLRVINRTGLRLLIADARA